MESFSIIITVSLFLSCSVILIARLFTERIDFLSVFSWAIAIVLSFLCFTEVKGTFSAMLKEDVYIYMLISFLCVFCYGLFSSFYQFSSFRDDRSCIEVVFLVVFYPMLIGSLFVFLDKDDIKHKQSLSEYTTYEERYCLAFLAYNSRPAEDKEELATFANQLRNEVFRYKVYNKCRLIVRIEPDYYGFDSFSYLLGCRGGGMIVIYENNTWRIIYYASIVVLLLIIISTLYTTSILDKNNSLEAKNRNLNSYIELLNEKYVNNKHNCF